MAKRRPKQTFLVDLIKILTPVPNSKKHIFIRQLHDGTVAVYDRFNLLSTFTYSGGKHIRNLVLNTKKYMGKSFGEIIRLDDYHATGGERLKVMLDELLPDAKDCNVYMKHALEFSIIEAALLDTDTRIELSDINRYGFSVAMVNIDGYTSSSFRFYHSGRLERIFIRYSGKAPDIRLDKILIPSKCMHLFTDLLTRELTPIG